MEPEELPRPAKKPLWQAFLVGRNPVFTLVRVVVWIVAALVIFKFVLFPIRVTGTSMAPTYKDRQIKFVNKLAYARGEPQRMDIVAVALKGQILLLKRIVGLPGETVQIVDGKITIDGEPLVEPYAAGIIFREIPERKGEVMSTSKRITLGPDEYFLVGDNREVSELHIEPRDRILGKVLF
jgi:signal peptidase I